MDTPDDQVVLPDAACEAIMQIIRDALAEFEAREAQAAAEDAA